MAKMANNDRRPSLRGHITKLKNALAVKIFQVALLMGCATWQSFVVQAALGFPIHLREVGDFQDVQENIIA